MRTKAIENARIVTCSKMGIIENGTVVWDCETGKIAFCGASENIPHGLTADKYNGKGMVITPGFIDAHTHIGIQESISETAGDDLTETLMGPVTPFINAIDAVNFNDTAFCDALSGGVTTVGILTGSYPPISGTGCIVKTCGNINGRIISSVSCLKGALGEIPKSESLKFSCGASTRGGNTALIRDTFYKAAYYRESKKHAHLTGSPFLTEQGYENIGLVLDKKIPFRIHAFRSDDIMTAMRLAREFSINVIIEHALEAAEVSKDLIKSDIPVFYGTALSWRYSNETKNTGYRGLKSILDCGVKAGIITDHGCTPVERLLLLSQLAVSEGVTWEDGIKLITSYPAEILGLRGKIGTLEAGADADINIFNGDPFHYLTKLEAVIVNGQEAWNREKYKTRWY
ncbi:amidohydrolase family protein [Lachnospiraceae bacterium NSJ-143]|nr:amidohydrolase family protein [Lachnospiraceae bacterium NSJ-143]